MKAADILHELPGTAFAVWEAPKRTRQPRFTVIEPGAGRRGTGRRRGTARTLAEATELAGTLQPSTTAEILADVTPFGDWDRALLVKLTTLGVPGTKLWILCDGGGYEAVSEGLAVNAVEALFGGDDELRCWLIRWRDPSGAECKGLYATALADAERAWWVLGDDGRVIAGGPPIFDEARACEIAAEVGGQAVPGTGELARKAA